MIDFEITAFPSAGKKLELEQSVESIRNRIGKLCKQYRNEILEDGSHKFFFHFDSEEQVKNLLENEGFLLLAGAIKTLCKKTTFLFNGKKIDLNEISFTDLTSNKEYKILTSIS